MCLIGTAVTFDTKYLRRCSNNKKIRKKCDIHFKHEFKSKRLIYNLKNSLFHFLFRQSAIQRKTEKSEINKKLEKKNICLN